MAPDSPAEEQTRLVFAEIVAAQERFSAIEVELAETVADSPSFELTFEELRTALDELVVAGEELEAQQAPLTGPRQVTGVAGRRYEILFALAPEAYLVTNPFGAMREANRAAAELLGERPEFLTGKALALYVEDVDRRQFRAGIAALPTGPALQRWPVRMRRRDRTTFVAEVTVRSMREQDGRVRSVLWQVRDISQQAQTEQDLRALTDQMEARVSARTRELSTANERLTAGLREVSALSRQLQHALESRVAIEQAKGRLMESLSIAAEPAFELLRRQARESGRKLRDVALDVADGSLRLTGEPTPPAPQRTPDRGTAHRVDSVTPRSQRG